MRGEGTQAGRRTPTEPEATLSGCTCASCCSDQLARQKDRLRVDIGHLSHPVYGAPELASALVDNPAEYLPIVSRTPRLVRPPTPGQPIAACLPGPCWNAWRIRQATQCTAPSPLLLSSRGF